MKSYGLIEPFRRCLHVKPFFLLAYGIEAMIPTEIGCPTHWVIYYTLKGNEHDLRTNLDFIEQ
jgi:hypothetical protein